MGIPAAFQQLGTVVEIDSDCLEDDYSSVRVVVAWGCPDRIPDDLWVANNDGLGATFQIDVLRAWRREDQLDGNGHLRPFFPSNRGAGGVYPLDHPANSPPGSTGNPLPCFGLPRPPALDVPCPFGGLGLATAFVLSSIRTYPLAPLPRLPIILPSRVLGLGHPVPSTPLCSILVLALPWYDVDSSPVGVSNHRLVILCLRVWPGWFC